MKKSEKDLINSVSNNPFHPEKVFSSAELKLQYEHDLIRTQDNIAIKLYNNNFQRRDVKILMNASNIMNEIEPIVDFDTLIGVCKFLMSSSCTVEISGLSKRKIAQLYNDAVRNKDYSSYKNVTGIYFI